MKNSIKEYLNFSNSEKRGIILLAALILLLIIANIFAHKFFSPEKYDFDDFFKITNSLNIAIENDSSDYRNAPYSSYKRKNYSFDFEQEPQEKRIFEPFPFNPNGLEPEKWKKLGLTDKQIRVIKNYESKGGKFYKKEDLKKMYCITENQYLQLEPWIVIPENEKKDTLFKKWEKKDYTKFTPTIVEINSADTAELMKISGIGSGFANRIIKYRQRLGGFAYKEQLLEVWGMDTARFNKIKDFITIDLQKIQKININQADIKTFLKHPYFDYQIALSIVQKRQKIGTFKSVEELKNIDYIHKFVFAKIHHYLTI